MRFVQCRLDGAPRQDVVEEVGLATREVDEVGFADRGGLPLEATRERDVIGVEEGEVIAQIAAPGPKTKISPHLHLTFAWIPVPTDPGRLTWPNLGTDPSITLLDPLAVLTKIPTLLDIAGSNLKITFSPDDAGALAQFATTIEEFGTVDILINNAGLAASALFGDYPDLKLFRHTVDVNFYGAVYCTYYALPYLKARRGRIVAVSSLGGKVTVPYNTPYCSSKFAMHGFFEALRTELAPNGVSCTLVCPWWVATAHNGCRPRKRRRV